MQSLHNCRAAIALFLAFSCAAAWAQVAQYEDIGKAPTEQEILAWDIAIGTDGKELPPGQGTARDGKPIFEAKCMACHGENMAGIKGMGSAFVGGKDLTSNTPMRTVQSYFPFATTLWDYINRAMPRFQEGTLTAEEVYALTAYILYKTEIIGESDVMDAQSLPKVKMPNRDGFKPARFEDIPDIKQRGCRVGLCP